MTDPSQELASYAALACALEQLDPATVEIEGIEPDRWKEIIEGSAPDKEEALYLVMFFKHKYLPGFFARPMESPVQSIRVCRSNEPEEPCFYCKSRPGELLCDGATPTGTCDRPMCATCCPMPFEGPHHFCKKCCPKCFCGAFALVSCQATVLAELVFSSIGLRHPMPCKELQCSGHMSYVIDPRTDAKPGALLALCNPCRVRLQIPHGTAEAPVKLSIDPSSSLPLPSRPDRPFCTPKPPASRPSLTLLPAPQETE